MNLKETEQKIQALQDRVKVLALKRDETMRLIGGEEQKLQEAYAKLRELGVDNPNKLTVKELEELTEKLQSQLDGAVIELTAKVEEGEKLLANV
jgi:hypothetical protein